MNRKKIVVLIVGLVIISSLIATYNVKVKAAEPQEQALHETEESKGYHYSKEQLLDLLWRGLNFFIFAAIIYYFASKPLSKLLKQREENTKTTLEELDKERYLARQKFLEYEARLAQLDKEKGKIISEFITLGEKEKQKIIEAAHKIAEQIKEAAKRTAAQEAKMAREGLKAEIAEIAIKTAEGIIREQLILKDHNELIERYLEKMEGI
jgi:F-type H+-transporting ATPase subunit b